MGFIKRFCTLDGKNSRVSREPALRILKALQKAIVEKIIRKTSPYAKEIQHIQENLIKIIESNASEAIEIPEKYKEIAKSQKINPETAIIKAFIAIQGKEGVKEKAKALLVRTEKIDNRSAHLVAIRLALKNYIKGETEVIVIENQTLQGLYGLAGIDVSPKVGEIVSSTALLGAQFDTLRFSGKWKTLIGNPDKNFRLMMFGKPGSGKSTLSLAFAGYLSKTLGLKVLYIAAEEKFGYTLQEKIVRLDVANSNLLTTDKVPANLERFDVVFFDSVNTLGLEPEQLRKLPKQTACVFVFQTTKEGLFRGSQEFSHDVDCVIKVENMKATTEKNRYGGERKEIAVC
ncbi:MAG: DNA repair protein RadA [Bacteroidales bacterium]|nr:DNA repair protein RadA [Bacteroidales bacterium]